MESRFPQLAQAGLKSIDARLERIRICSDYGLSTKDEIEQRLNEINLEIEELEQEAWDLESLLSIMDADEIEDAGAEVAALMDERRRIESYLKSVSGSTAEVKA